MSFITDLIEMLSGLFGSTQEPGSGAPTAPSGRSINQAGINLIKQFEGLRLKAYKDSVGIWTVGYGHTGADVTSGMVITEQGAENLLKQDLATFESGVSRLVTVAINDNQFAALVAFSFNVGLGNLQRSGLLRMLNAGDYKGASGEFVHWAKAGGVVLPGLVKRRQAETDLFLTAA